MLDELRVNKLGRGMVRAKKSGSTAIQSLYSCSLFSTFTAIAPAQIFTLSLSDYCCAPNYFSPQPDPSKISFHTYQIWSFWDIDLNMLQAQASEHVATKASPTLSLIVVPLHLTYTPVIEKILPFTEYSILFNTYKPLHIFSLCWTTLPYLGDLSIY